jgi:hypothetical protein
MEDWISVAVPQVKFLVNIREGGKREREDRAKRENCQNSKK